jgi:hypothetical protein
VATDVLALELFEDDPCRSSIGSLQRFARDPLVEQRGDKTLCAAGGAKARSAIRPHAISDAPTTGSAPERRVRSRAGRARARAS